MGCLETVCAVLGSKLSSGAGIGLRASRLKYGLGFRVSGFNPFFVKKRFQS